MYIFGYLDTYVFSSLHCFPVSAGPLRVLDLTHRALRKDTVSEREVCLRQVIRKQSHEVGQEMWGTHTREFILKISKQPSLKIYFLNKIMNRTGMISMLCILFYFWCMTSCVTCWLWFPMFFTSVISWLSNLFNRVLTLSGSKFSARYSLVTSAFVSLLWLTSLWFQDLVLPEPCLNCSHYFC